MSKSYTTGSMTNGANRQPTTTTPSGRQQQPQGVDERTERRDAYTVIAPNEEKRRSVQRVAEAEQRSLEEYRERNRYQYVGHVGTVGGIDSGVNITPRSRELRGNATGSHLSVQQKSQKYRMEQKRREEESLEKMKREQRQKSIVNAEKMKTREEKLDEDRRKKMDSFLNKIEAESMKPRRNAADSAEAARSSSSLQSVETSTDNPSDDDADDDDVEQLVSRFPYFLRSELQALLVECGGSVVAVVRLLSNSAD